MEVTLPQLDSDWSIISKEDIDFEVQMQIEFLCWLESHQARLLQISHHSNRYIAPPFMDFSQRLQIISLCGLVWYVSIDRTCRSGHPFSFKLHRVTSLIDDHHQCFHGTSPAYHSGLGSADDADFDNAFDCIIEPFAFTRAASRQIDSKSFLCNQSVESSTSLHEVLDALLEFSAWYSTSFTHESSQEQELTLQDLQFETSIMRAFSGGVMISVRRQAQEAQQQCQFAKVALKEASQGSAIMLMEAFNSQLMPPARRPYVDEEPLTQAEWSKTFMCSHAIKHGYVLQWCTIEIYGPLISCKLDIGEFLLEPAQQDAARSVGILANQPLMIKLDDEACLLGISQELDAEERINQDGIENNCHTDGDWSSCMEFPNLISWPPTKLGTDTILKAIVESTISEYKRGSLSGNLFVNILQKVSWHLVLLSSICVVCAEPKEPSALPSTCGKELCSMTFSGWRGIARLDLEELELPAELVNQMSPII